MRLEFDHDIYSIYDSFNKVLRKGRGATITNIHTYHTTRGETIQNHKSFIAVHCGFYKGTLRILRKLQCFFFNWDFDSGMTKPNKTQKKPTFEEKRPKSDLLQWILQNITSILCTYSLQF